MSDRRNMSDRIYIEESVHAFYSRNGVIVPTIEKRFSSDALKSSNVHKKDTKAGSGYIIKIGEKNIKRNTTMNQLREMLQESPKDAIIVEMYPTRFCSNCKRSSWQFVESQSRGHATCGGCGTVQKTSASHMGTLYLNDSGKANKANWECTPGMDHNDTILTKNGRRYEIASQRPTSHLRNYWRIRKKIDGIAQFWNFSAIDALVRSAKAKLKKFYHHIHDGKNSDNARKLPHGGAALAAACFYCAVLEFEHRVHYKTVCSLPAIQEQAQLEVDRNKYRKTRDVTELVILKYAAMLKKYELCLAPVPQIGAETLKFTPTSAALEHARMALFTNCQPVKFHLPTHNTWGLQVGDTQQGVLYIDSIETEGIAFKTGLRKGDFIFQFQGNTMEIDCTPGLFHNTVVATKKNSNQPQVEISIMRKKK
jgi:hypothetical protein